MSKFNGHKNWNHWNVSLWIGNDQSLYNEAKRWIARNDNKQEAAKDFLESLRYMGITHTPDGAPYSYSSIRAAMVGM
jgi:hypothetical protein